MNCSDNADFDFNDSPITGLNIICCLEVIFVAIFVFLPVNYINRQTGVMMSLTERYAQGGVMLAMIAAIWCLFARAAIIRREKFKKLNRKIDALSSSDGTLSVKNTVIILGELNNI